MSVSNQPQPIYSPPPVPEKIRKVFEQYPGVQKNALLALRKLILETAEETPGVGVVEETLKWGQPSYLTSQTKSGTTIRIDILKHSETHIGLFVHCQTDLISRFQRMFGDAITTDGKRVIILDGRELLPLGILKPCIAMAFRYHLDK